MSSSPKPSHQRQKRSDSLTSRYEVPENNNNNMLGYFEPGLNTYRDPSTSPEEYYKPEPVLAFKVSVWERYFERERDIETSLAAPTRQLPRGRRLRRMPRFPTPAPASQSAFPARAVEERKPLTEDLEDAQFGSVPASSLAVLPQEENSPFSSGQQKQQERQEPALVPYEDSRWAPGYAVRRTNAQKGNKKGTTPPLEESNVGMCQTIRRACAKLSHRLKKMTMDDATTSTGMQAYESKQDPVSITFYTEESSLFHNTNQKPPRSLRHCFGSKTFRRQKTTDESRFPKSSPSQLSSTSTVSFPRYNKGAAVSANDILYRPYLFSNESMDDVVG
jgi:hypothetical protein